MIPINEAKTEIGTLKDAVREWFEALTGVFGHSGAVASTAYTPPRAAFIPQGNNTLLGQFMGWLLVSGGTAVATLYLAQSVDWSAMGVNLLLKAVSWL